MDQFPVIALQNGNLNPDAPVAYVGLIEAMYCNQINLIQKIIDSQGGGKIAAYRFQPDDLHPSYCIIKQGDVCIIVTCGSSNIDPQGITHCLGTLTATPYTNTRNTLGKDVYVNQRWKKTQADMRNDVLRVPLVLGSKKLRFIGHSYGSAINFLMANSATSDYAGKDIEVLDFGAPRAITKGFLPQGYRHFRIVAQNDPVPTLPPEATNIWIGAIPVIGDLFGKAIIWQHNPYSDRYNLTNDGKLTYTNEADADKLLDLNSPLNDLYQAHLLGNYIRLLSKNQAAKMVVNNNTATDKINLIVAATPRAPDRWQDTPTSQYVFPDIQTAVDIYGIGYLLTANGINIAQQVKVQSKETLHTAFNPFTPAQTQGQNPVDSVSIKIKPAFANGKWRYFGANMATQIQCTFFFKHKSQGKGWTEKYFLVNEMDLGVALVKAEQLARKRGGFCGLDITIEKVVVSGNPKGDSRVKILGEILTDKSLQSFEGSPGDPLADFAENGVQCRFETGSDFNRRVAILSGTADFLTHTGDKTPADAQGGGVAWAKAFKLFTDIATNGDYGMLALDKDPMTNPEKLIGSFTPIVGPPNNITISSTAHGFANNQKVRLYENKGQGDNPNGVWNVRVLDANSFQLMGYELLNSGAGGTWTPTKLGKVRAVKYKVIAYSTIQPQGYAHRRRGLPNSSAKPKSRKKK